jgi:hypothetical protein
MPELLHTILVLAIIFLVVFALNVMPAFAPPTWAVVSFIAMRFSSNIVVLAVLAAVAATLGRLLLAKLSTVILRQKFLGEGTRRNIDVVRERLERKTKLTSGLFLFYAFSPLPSNHLFIAYGLTALRLKLIAFPFLLGRTVSYAFWAFTASGVASMFSGESVKTGSFFSLYFIATQIFGLLTIWAFTRIDWQKLFEEKKLRWRRSECRL